MNIIKTGYHAVYLWISRRFMKLLAVAVIHETIQMVFKLPYINLLTQLLSFFPILLDWIAIYILFKPTKLMILHGAFLLLLAIIPFSIIHVNFILEQAGEFVFVLISTYVLLSLWELRSEK